MTIEEVIVQLNELSNPEKAEFKKKKYNIQAENTLGIYNVDLNQLARKIGKDSTLAIQLFESNIYEARLLCAKIFPIAELNEKLIEKWVITFENWEVTDTFCMGVFAKSKFAVPKIFEWGDRQPEFERRCSFATIAGFCSHDKKVSNKIFQSFFPIIIHASTDERLYVKKAVNWALRSIGKRNRDLQKEAILISEKILKIDSKSAQWIAKDALKELQKGDVRMSDYPRNIYRSK